MEDRKLISSRRVCERHDISDRTLARRLRDERLGFPKPIVIRGRRYWDAEALEAWERTRASQMVGA